MNFEESRPIIGEPIAELSTGEVLGNVTHFSESGNIVFVDRFIAGTQENDGVIWKFSEELNKLHTWPNKKS